MYVHVAPGAAVCCANAEAARSGGPPAGVRARRRIELASLAPGSPPARRARPGAEDPGSGAPGDAGCLALQEDRFLPRPARAGHGLGIARAVGELHGAASARTRDRVCRRAPRARPAQARLRFAARDRTPRGGGSAAGPDAGRVAARRGRDHRLEPELGADRAALRTGAQRLRGGSGRRQAVAGAGAGIRPAVAAVAVRRARLLGGRVRGEALARAAAWVTSLATGPSIRGSISSTTAPSALDRARGWCCSTTSAARRGSSFRSRRWSAA